MRVPDDVQRIAIDGLNQMRVHPQHHFPWRIRRELYHQFKLLGDAKGRRAHGWMAVLTAEHVLPIFTSTYPNDRLPARLVHYAKKVMLGEISPTVRGLDALEEFGYLSRGVDCIDVRGETAYNAEYAGTAAYKALMEARGKYHFLDRVATLRREAGFMVMGRGSRAPMFDHLEHISSITDEDIAHLAAFSDTASPAAIASACGRHRFHPNPDRLHTFWEWWVEVALPEAWERVE